MPKGICALPAASEDGACAPPTSSKAHVYTTPAFHDACTVQAMACLAVTRAHTCEKISTTKPKGKWRPKLIMSYFSPTLNLEAQKQQVSVPTCTMLGMADSNPLSLVSNLIGSPTTDLRDHLNM